MVEHSAVNRTVVGSSPTSGAIFLFSVSEPITLKKDAISAYCDRGEWVGLNTLYGTFKPTLNKFSDSWRNWQPR